MKHLSIKWNIFSVLLLFSGLLLLLLWLFQVVFLDRFYQSIKIRELRSTATTIEKSIDREDIRRILSAYSKNKDLSIEVFRNDGSSMYSYKIGRDFALENMTVFDKLNLLAKAQQEGGEFLSPVRGETTLTSQGDETWNAPPPMSMVLAKVIPLSDKEPLGLLIGSTISPVDATVSTLRTQLYYITLFMVIFSIALALILAKHISAPMEKLTASAKELATGNYQVRFNAAGYREIDDLSHTLNHTAQELSQVERLRQELIANISHDLRTPLTLITGYGEMMRDIPGENTPDNIKVIIDESRRLSSLVSDVLELSQLQSGSEIFHPQEYNLTQSVQATVDRLQEFLRQEGYHLRFDYEEPVSLTADPVKTTQVIYNLLINAVNHTGEDKTVNVRQELTTETVLLRIQDSGCGIPADILPHIWQRYYKTKEYHQRPVTGSGLGLSIVKNLVEQQGGACGVDSVVGRGSTFWFTLPRK